MKALSLWQPWAWLIIRPDLSGRERALAIEAQEIKDVENRNCPLDRFPGLSRPVRLPLTIYIHAARSFDHDAVAFVRSRFPHIRLPDRYDLGGLVGKTTIHGCVEHSSSPWFFGPHGFLVRDSEAIPFRPLRGQQGFFEVEDERTPDLFAAATASEPKPIVLPPPPRQRELL